MLFLSLGVDGISNIFDLKTQQIVHRIESHALPVRSCSFSPNGTLLYTASDDRHVNIFDTKSGRVVHSFSHTGNFSAPNVYVVQVTIYKYEELHEMRI